MPDNPCVLQTLSWEKDYEKLDEYLAGLTRQIKDIVPLKITGHPIVNAILVQGTKRAREMGAEFRCQVVLPEALPIPDEDLTAFLMNLVNNALEAVELIRPDRPRWVEITLHIRGKYLFIEGRDPYTQKPESGTDGDGIFLARTALLMPQP